MGVILLEALGALSALVLIVWWTMFSGRPKGEPPGRHEPPSPTVSAALPTPPVGEIGRPDTDPDPLDQTASSISSDSQAHPSPSKKN